MSELRFLIAVFALAAPAALAQTTAAAAAGKVVLVEGEARFLDSAGGSRRVVLGDRVYQGERLVTGPDGEVHLAMEDGGYIGVRPATEMSIELFKADGGPDDRSEISLVKGSFRTVTGWIGGAGAALIRTFDATIGVRGTDHEPLVVPAGAVRGEPGTYDRVHVGATFMRTPQGMLNVAQGQAGFVPRGEAMGPEVLAVVPSLFQPTKNEARFAGLHDRLQGELGKLREDRRSGDRGESGRGSERADRPAKAERPERPERTERADRPDRPQRPDKPDRPGRK